jgi:hypothetical protein
MTSNLCCTDEQYWSEATTITVNALKKRIELWDAVYQEIKKLD